MHATRTRHAHDNHTSQDKEFGDGKGGVGGGGWGGGCVDEASRMEETPEERRAWFHRRRDKANQVLAQAVPKPGIRTNTIEHHCNPLPLDPELYKIDTKGDNIRSGGAGGEDGVSAHVSGHKADAADL